MPINKLIPGQLYDAEMKTIELLASLVPARGHIVEVGSLLGLSSWIWAKSADPSVTVHCIDLWELGGGGNFATLAAKHNQIFSLEQFLKNVADCPNVVAHQGCSPQDFLDWNTTIDLYFEDAVHTDPILSRNLEFWCGHLHPNGIVCGHDYTDRFPDVRAGAARLAARYQRRLQVVGSLWFILPGALAAATSDDVRLTVARLTELERMPKPAVSPANGQRAAALAKANEISSFAYEMVLEGLSSGAIARPDHGFVLRGTVRNTSGCDWPTYLGPDLYLEVGAELHVESEKIAAARQAVAGRTIAAGQSFEFELHLPVTVVGAGVCTIDLLYRHLFWFSARGAEAKKIPIPPPAGNSPTHPTPGSRNAEQLSTPRPPARWFHSYDFGGGEIAKGSKPLSILKREADAFFSEPIAGMTVLDIGAWDGYFSFEAERRGAADVLATDHFCWSGPGWGSKAGFDYAHAKFKSHVRSLDVDVFALDPAKLGVFDVTLFLGVLYHLKNPFGGLEQVSRMTRTYAVIETAVAELDHPAAVMRYYLGDELNGDPTNFFAPNHKCLEYMLRDVGFRRFKFSTIGYPSAMKRVIVHAWKSREETT